MELRRTVFDSSFQISLASNTCRSDVRGSSLLLQQASLTKVVTLLWESMLYQA